MFGTRLLQLQGPYFIPITHLTTQYLFFISFFPLSFLSPSFPSSLKNQKPTSIFYILYRIIFIMAQKTEKEETEFKVPETITLCINNCGVIGNPATNNMCQNCFTASTATTSSAGICPPISRSNTVVAVSVRSPKRSFPEEETSQAADPPSSDQTTPSEAKRVVNRCSGCRRKVGLTGFRCRCGQLFCGEHRYSDRHDCTFDYKAAGREAIARENPVVRAAKIVKV